MDKRVDKKRYVESDEYRDAYEAGYCDGFDVGFDSKSGRSRLEAIAKDCMAAIIASGVSGEWKDIATGAIAAAHTLIDRLDQDAKKIDDEKH